MSWDFDCPQYVDFNSEVILEDDEDSNGSRNEELELKLPGARAMEAVLTLKNQKSNAPLGKSPHVNVFRRHKQKIKRLSKSDGSIKTVGKEPIKHDSYHPLFNKSLSECDMRPKKKYPVTPIKQRMLKAKAKKGKTTEELQLEKIAELQKLMLKHLRSNELTLKRMNQKSKILQPQAKSKAIATKDVPKDRETAVKENNYAKIMRPKSKIPCSLSVKETLKGKKTAKVPQAASASTSKHPTKTSNRYEVLSSDFKSQGIKPCSKDNPLARSSKCNANLAKRTENIRESQSQGRKPASSYNASKNYPIAGPSKPNVDLSKRVDNIRISTNKYKVYFGSHSSTHQWKDQPNRFITNKKRKSTLNMPGP